MDRAVLGNVTVFAFRKREGEERGEDNGANQLGINRSALRHENVLRRLAFCGKYRDLISREGRRDRVLVRARARAHMHTHTYTRNRLDYYLRRRRKEVHP